MAKKVVKNTAKNLPNNMFKSGHTHKPRLLKKLLNRNVDYQVKSKKS